MSTQSGATRRAEFTQGVRDTFPLVVGAIPFGIIFGAVGVTSGLSAGATQAMSAFVFAGAAQFIATGLIASGAPTGVIVFTTLVVNLRHLLYGATLAPFVAGLPQRWLAPLGFWLTDETFVVTINRYRQGGPTPHRHWYFFGSAVFMYSNWQVCTYIGLQAGQAIENPMQWGLDFAMIVTFIGMLVPLTTSRPALVTVITAGATALVARDLPNQLGLMAAALAGILAGLIAERWWAPDLPASPAESAPGRAQP